MMVPGTSVEDEGIEVYLPHMQMSILKAVAENAVHPLAWTTQPSFIKMKCS